ncbi:MAG: glycosyltransferase [Candidatus Methylomirabilales bacterium]
MAATASLIVSVYNQPRELELVLLRLLQQTARDFEVVVADDGSTPETAELVADWRRRAPFPVQHCWQEHRGYRLPVILNKASLAARGDYLIFLNGDCLPHRRYVESHLRFARPDAVLNGRRGVMVEPALGRRLSPRLVGSRHFDAWPRLLWWWLRRELRGVERAVRFESRLLRRLVPDHENLIGADFSLHRRAMFEANGFDETMADLGGSDRELGHRLQLLGLRLVNTRNLTVTYHLEHPRHPARPHPQGELKRLLAENRVPVCRHGLRELRFGSEIGTALKRWLAAERNRGATTRSDGRLEN